MNSNAVQETLNADPEHTDRDNRGSGWVAALVFILLLGTIALFVADRLYHPEKFRIEQVDVRGQFQHVNDKQVKRVVEKSLSGNYFSVSLAQLEQNIREMPWVFDAAVRRQWPSTLVVEIEEVQPIAEWGDEQWLNASGALVNREPWNQPLPILHGPGSMQKEVWQAFQEWHGMFAAHGLSLDRLELDERELWYLTLSLTALAMDRNALSQVEGEDPIPTAEVTMIVDNSDASARIERLIEALNSQLIAEFPGMRSIDLRYPNGFAINWIKKSPDNQKLTESE